MKRKGFTLVELLVTIILLGIVGGIIIYNMTSVSNSSKESEYEKFVAKVKSASAVYADLNPEAFDELYVSKAYLYITVDDLIKNGLIDDDLKNPYTEEAIGPKEKIKANLDNTSGALTFTYPIDKQEDETFLVAISDYVVYGEPYNCMTGAGTYRLALSGEDGELIQLANEDGTLNGDTIKKYNIECSFDSEGNFKKYDKAIDAKIGDDVVKSYDYMYSETPGTYKITYTWITESKTKKQATRNIVVNAKIVPELNFTSKSGEVVADNSIYKPTTEDCTNWDYLEFKPAISGADLTKTTYSLRVGLTKDTLKDYVTQSGLKLIDSNDYSNSYPALDGTHVYEISTKVKGHYFEDYSYDSVNYQTITQDLVMKDCLIHTPTKTWATDKTYTIDPINYSIVGIDRYEYTLVEDESDAPANDSKETYPSTTAKDGKFELKATAITEGACANDTDLKNYKYVYIRAINKEGYKGSEWHKFDGYLTNSLSKVIGDTAECLPINGLPAESQTIINNSKLLKGLKCIYRSKDVIIKWGNKKYVVLGKYDSSDSNKEEVLIATDDVIDTNTRISMTQIKYRTWWIQTCDGLYSASFNYVSPAFNNLKVAVKDFYDNGLSGVDNKDKLAVYSTDWKAVIGEVDFNKMPTSAAYIGGSAQWSKWANALSVKDTYYESRVGTPNKDDYFVFGDALNSINTSGKNYAYWLATTFQSGARTVRVRHGDSMTYTDTHFYAVSGTVSDQYVADPVMAGATKSYQKQCHKENGKDVCENLPYVLGYAGATAYVKGMMILDKAPIIKVGGEQTYEIPICK